MAKVISMKLGNRETMKAEMIVANLTELVMPDVDNRLTQLFDKSSRGYMRAYSNLFNMKASYPTLTGDQLMKLVDECQNNPAQLGHLKCEKKDGELLIYLLEFDREDDSKPTVHGEIL